MTPPRLRVASDVGGTFTDNLAYDEAARHVTVAKVPTTPENRALGTVRGLRQALAAQNRAGRDVAYVGHGMTTATNAVIQRSGGRVAFITNEGFRDLLLIGRQNRPSLYDIRRTRPQPLVPREDCHTVRGRLDPAGHEVTPLDEAGLRRMAEQLRRDHIEAVAICLLHPYANPEHERRARAISCGRIARHPGLHLDRYPRRIPRIRARQHGRAERLPAAGDRALSRLPDRAPRRSGRGAGTRARCAG